MADLRDIPAIRAEAERLAAEHHTALARVINRSDLDTQAPTLPAWEHLSPSYREMRVEAHLDLLCDLSRPASRDAVARLVAAKVGMFCHDTAPLFERHGADWKMVGPNGQAWWFVTGGHPWLSLYGATGWTIIADLSPDFQEAIRAIALHVLGASDV